MKDFQMKDFLNNEYKTKKSMKLKECIVQDRLEDFNKIVEITKEIDLNFDNKRIWSDKGRSYGSNIQ